MPLRPYPGRPVRRRPRNHFRDLVGALIFGMLSNGLILMNVSEGWQLTIRGLVIVDAVALDRYRNKGGART